MAVEFSFLSDQSPALQEVTYSTYRNEYQVRSNVGEEETMRENGDDLTVRKRGEKGEEGNQMRELKEDGT